jgi:hypothetical protein
LNFEFSMIPREPHPDIDHLLREHFSAALDGQLGRAPAAFARSSRRRPWRVALLAGAGLAAAAAAVVLMVLRPAPSRPLAPAQTPVQYEVAWQSIDQGTVLIDGEPLHSVHHQRVDQFKWVDPETHQTIEVSVPSEALVLTELESI